MRWLNRLSYYTRLCFLFCLAAFAFIVTVIGLLLFFCVQALADQEIRTALHLDDFNA